MDAWDVLRLHVEVHRDTNEICEECRSLMILAVREVRVHVQTVVDRRMGRRASDRVMGGKDGAHLGR